MSDTEQILFGGVGALPARVAEFKKPKPGERPRWVEVLEAAFVKLTSTEEGRRLYGDPNKGATVEQAWRTNGLMTGKFPVCLLSTDKPSVPTDAIERLVKLNSKELVAALTELFDMGERMGVPILYHDGNMGHSVSLMSYEGDAGRFTYHDPWPGDSLLCRDFNAAGVDARPQGGYWSITSGELEKVIFAAFVARPFWSEYVGEKYYATYDEFKDSDFWRFFHLKEAGRQGPGEDGKTLVTLKTGGFQSEIDLSVTVNSKNRLAEGTLGVKRGWVIGPPHGLNPYALDVVKSFIGALVPPPDLDAASPLVEMLGRITDPAYGEQLVNEGPDKSIWHRALFTYLGPSPSFEAPLRYSNVSMKNTERDGEGWLDVQVTTDAL